MLKINPMQVEMGLCAGQGEIRFDTSFCQKKIFNKKSLFKLFGKDGAVIEVG